MLFRFGEVLVVAILGFIQFLYHHAAAYYYFNFYLFGVALKSEWTITMAMIH